ncbi:MAG: 5-formyltetrahydrofolate cyclo-ligase [Bacilli bacterium]
MKKTKARKLCFIELSNITNKGMRDLVISEKLNKELSKYKNIGVYMPIRNECVLNLDSNFTLCYPRVIGKEMKYFDDSMGFETSKFGIKEPISDDEIIPDIIIAPCVGFFENYRLGYGGGFYDRYLSKHQIKTIGIAYKETKLNSLEFNDYDICLSEIIEI